MGLYSLRLGNDSDGKGSRLKGIARRGARVPRFARGDEFPRQIVLLPAPSHTAGRAPREDAVAP
jgi:hypothetical protein